MDWSAGVLGVVRRRVRMQPAATLAVCFLLVGRIKMKEDGIFYHAVAETVYDFV